MFRLVGAFLLGVLLAACAQNGLNERRAASSRLAAEGGWNRLDLDAGRFRLVAFVQPGRLAGETLTVYIEGDGLAWIDPSTPSLDPTPLEPVALRLAMAQPSGTVAYLARPCQYVGGIEGRGCERKYWTSHRFAPEVVDAANRAIDQLKQRVDARSIELVGYSGGGAVAALVAARRRDVAGLVSVAGNLDHEAWTRLHRDSPLSGSLNPVADAHALADISQLHFVGGRDQVVPAAVARSYQEAFPSAKRPPLQVVDDFDHVCCWAQRWPDLYRQVIAARRTSLGVSAPRR